MAEIDRTAMAAILAVDKPPLEVPLELDATGFKFDTVGSIVALTDTGPLMFTGEGEG